MSSLSSLLSSSSSSTSAIDLSSLLQAATGASSSGIDVTSAVNAAVAAAQAPETAWESSQTTLQSQQSALTQIQTDTTNLDEDMQALNSLNGPLSARTVTSSNSSIVSASASSGSTVGNHIINVNSLASTAVWSSSTLASDASTLPAGSFALTTAGGTSTVISTGSGTSTLDDVASTINADNLGVTASVVTDSSGSRLAIVSNGSGSANNFTVSSGSLNFTQAQAGADASLTVDGIPITSASNTVTGAVPGLTLSLLNATPGTNVSLSVAPDTTQAATAINKFVTDYNTAINDVNAQFTDTGSGEGVLATDSAVRNLQTDLQSALNYIATSPSGSPTTTVPDLSALGIAVQQDGTLSVDSAALSSALQNNFSDVQNFFQGSALNGFANTFDQQLTSFTSSDGAFTVDLQSLNTQYTDLQTNINNYETNYITPLRTQLQSEYSQAEILLQQLPTTEKQISTELGTNSSS